MNSNSISISMDEAAKVLGTTKQKLNALLRARGVFHETGDLKNTPHEKFRALGFFDSQLTKYTVGPVERFHIKTRVTANGILWLKQLLDTHTARLKQQKEPA